MNIVVRLTASLGLLVVSATALADTVEAPATAAAAGPPVWLLEGPSNRVYLLGSVHLLRAGDYPLGPAVEQAYADAEALVMELDMDAIDPVASQTLLTQLGMVDDGRDLRARLGEEAWQRASSYARELEIDLERLSATEPWFTAMTVLNLAMLRAGFDPAKGIEAHFTERAVRDGKTIDGLETMEFQLGLFDAMDADLQREFLLQTLEQATELEQHVAPLLRAWRAGDRAALRAELEAGFEDFPDLHDALVTRRNATWLGQIEALLQGTDDYLLIVGALHLVGEDGLLQGLAARGHCLRRLPNADKAQH